MKHAIIRHSDKMPVPVKVRRVQAKPRKSGVILKQEYSKASLRLKKSIALRRLGMKEERDFLAELEAADLEAKMKGSNLLAELEAWAISATLPIEEIKERYRQLPEEFFIKRAQGTRDFITPRDNYDDPETIEAVLKLINY